MNYNTSESTAGTRVSGLYSLLALTKLLERFVACCWPGQRAEANELNYLLPLVLKAASGDPKSSSDSEIVRFLMFKLQGLLSRGVEPTLVRAAMECLEGRAKAHPAGETSRAGTADLVGCNGTSGSISTKPARHKKKQRSRLTQSRPAKQRDLPKPKAPRQPPPFDADAIVSIFGPDDDDSDDILEVVIRSKALQDILSSPVGSYVDLIIEHTASMDPDWKRFEVVHVDLKGLPPEPEF